MWGLAHKPVIFLSALRSIPSPASPPLGMTKLSTFLASGKVRPIGGPDRDWKGGAGLTASASAHSSSVSFKTSLLKS